MNLPSRSLVLAAFALTGATACVTDPGKYCDPCFAAALVYGSVHDSTGAPVPGAFVRILGADSSCTVRPSNISGRWFATNAQGQYRSFEMAASPYTGCLQVEATRPSGSAGPDTAFVSPRIRFKSETAGPPDSVRVNLVLPWSP